MRFAWALLAVAGIHLVTVPETNEECRVTLAMASSIRKGCGFQNSTMCTYDGCFRHPDVVEIGPLVHRTLMHVARNQLLPAYIVVEHQVGTHAWEKYNATGLRAVECFMSHQHIFGALMPA
jgi:hypothetical protein